VRLRIQVQSTGAPRRKKNNATDEKPYLWARRDQQELSEVSARERMEKQREYDDTAKARRESKLDQRRRGVDRRKEEEEAMLWLMELSQR
jgi:hypothetical protein